METNLTRIKDHIEKIAEFTATPGRGITIFSYSNEDQRAKDYLIYQMKKIGLKINIDPIGNIRARLEGINPDAPVVITGSHIDTVRFGGKFDGIAGVVGGLELLTVLVENGVKTYNPVELIVFIEEEGVNFGSALIGSKTLIGAYTVDDLKSFKNDQGISLYEVAKKTGLNPDRMSEHVLKPEEVKAMIEMHIEQSIILNLENIPVGIVEVIAGRKSVLIELQGVSNHAGATPMEYRHDPLIGAAQIIMAINQIVREQALPTTVGTVGKITCKPNMPNVIPERVNFVLDLRDIDPKGIALSLESIKEKIKEVSKTHGLDFQIKILGETKPLKLSNMVNDIIEGVAREKKIPYRKMNSGALHDACILGEITEVGMIFIPSIGGRSHVMGEKTSFNDIKVGCDLLLGSIIKLAT